MENVLIMWLAEKYPKQIRILRGPECVSRPRPFSHRSAVESNSEPPDLEEMFQGLEVDA